jgi:hypothetical protein
VEGGGGMRIDVGSSSLAFIFLLNRLMPGAIKCLSLNKASGFSTTETRALASHTVIIPK